MKSAPSKIWKIHFNPELFQVYFQFTDLYPQLHITIEYSKWKRIISRLKSLDEEFLKRKKAGDVFYGLNEYRNLYLTPQGVQRLRPILSRKYGRNVKDIIRADEKRTGYRRKIIVHIEDFYRFSLLFSRDKFIRFKRSLLKADQMMIRRLRLKKQQNSFRLV